MEKRFEQKTEAGGESEAWIHRAFEQRETKLAREDDTDDNKLAGLDHNERTEFYMHVAQRFKDAGERVINFIKGNDRATEPVLQERIDTRPSLSRAEAMYADEYEDDLSHVPDLQIPSAGAPPFDFAVQRKASSGLRPQPNSAVQVQSQFSVIDDFDHPDVEQDAEHVVVTKDYGVTTITYRPRVRDMLFASGVGRQIVGSVTQPAPIANDLQLATDQTTQPAEQPSDDKQDVHAAGLEHPNRDVLKTVKQAVEALLENEPAYPAEAADSIANEPAEEADTFRELSYQNLKPSQDGVRVVASKQPQPPIFHPKPIEPSELENPFGDKLRSSQAGQASSRENATINEPQSVSQILQNRTRLPKAPKEHHVHIPNVSQRRRSNNLMVVVTIGIIVLVALLLSTTV